MNKDGSTEVTHSNTYAADSPSYHSTNLCITPVTLTNQPWQYK